jgi:phosphoribosylaminoimidazole-succinocarboxamide synthase
MPDVVLSTDLPFPKRSGKVRDVYDVSRETGVPSLLIIATDRISAFDCVMPNGIPGKGKLLTQISNFWFENLRDVVPNHLIHSQVDEFPKSIREHCKGLERRSIIGRKADVVPIECVARGYLAGSGWKEYQASRSVCGIELPAGLRQCDRLPVPIFTPATKEASGHDINVNLDAAISHGGRVVETMRRHTLELYQRAADHARSCGILIADTKFEFGIADGELVLIDEILTPDSSRFWPAADFSAGRDQASFDKQFVRNWLEGQPWNKTPPAPALPDAVVAGTRSRYVEAYERLTGKTWRD